MKAQSLPNFPALVLLVRNILAMICEKSKHNFNNDMENNAMIGDALHHDYNDWEVDFADYLTEKLDEAFAISYCDSVNDIIENYHPALAKLLAQEPANSEG